MVNNIKKIKRSVNMGKFGIKTTNTSSTGSTTSTAKKTNEQKQQLTLKSVQIFDSNGRPTAEIKDPTTTTTNNYYRSVNVFGNIASKKDQYPDQPFVESQLKKLTQSTKDVENVIVNIEAEFDSETHRDIRAFDIGAKSAGVGGFSVMNGSDAYNFFLEVNKK